MANSVEFAEEEHDLAAMRRHYQSEGLAEADLPADPHAQFTRWFREAAASDLHEPNAMVVSTADATGRPSSRTVLLKGHDERGFVFYTNYGSRKAREIEVNPYVSLLFPWYALSRQVVVTGTAQRVSREETTAYFTSRPYGSQIGAWASAQSTAVASRAELDAAYARMTARFPEGEPVPVPPHWGGFRVTPLSVEFWQGRENRLHDRLRYVWDEDGSRWTVERLCP
ncbi:pyridoxine/pyridoxamine 5'-phosphate oxidase [Streptomyces mashuensis]|uniref:Pyridoxine/pyridoxamine 5'-phosphate oxidase n=1 Tax=Streptomyces mashuensis TaxID=33904 RepID=A0A919B2R4_9ACTN|nr:pyridoxine/pyridoxamine 5'-phosphate oxidase [Streptomyces mashuensis]